jgi:hypothetical protein
MFCPRSAHVFDLHRVNGWSLVAGSAGILIGPDEPLISSLGPRLQRDRHHTDVDSFAPALSVAPQPMALRYSFCRFPNGSNLPQEEENCRPMA